MTVKFVPPGTHLLLDFFGAKNLRDEHHVEAALRAAALACRATVLQIMLHHFGEGAGVTGVVLLAESHLSIHTWPETGYAAIDIFMCGGKDPEAALPALRDYFQPESHRIVLHRRGIE